MSVALHTDGLNESGELTDTVAAINGRTVQYFERARFEWHPENSPPWDILLGRLGAEVYP